jgi:hypothetical protein
MGGGDLVNQEPVMVWAVPVAMVVLGPIEVVNPKLDKFVRGESVAWLDATELGGKLVSLGDKTTAIKVSG